LTVQFGNTESESTGPSRQASPSLLTCGEVETTEIPGLVGQHLSLVLERTELIVDLLERSRRSQKVLAVLLGTKTDSCACAGVPAGLRPTISAQLVASTRTDGRPD